MFALYFYSQRELRIAEEAEAQAVRSALLVVERAASGFSPTLLPINKELMAAEIEMVKATVVSTIVMLFLNHFYL